MEPKIVTRFMDQAELDRLRTRTTQIQFLGSPEEIRLFVAIGERAAELARRYFRQTRGKDMGPGDLDVFQLQMDIANVHLNGRPLQLLAFLLADETDFAHDIGQIHRFVDRRDGGIPAAVPLLFAQSGERPAGASAGIILPH
jgi:hypothetical protein